MQQPLVPGMSQYSDDVDMDAGTADHPGNKKLSQEADVESVVSFRSHVRQSYYKLMLYVTM